MQGLLLREEKQENNKDSSRLLEEAKKLWSSQDFGRKVGEVRKKRRMSQEELGEAIGMRQSVVSDIERGNYPLTLDLVEKLAVALNVSPVELAITYWKITLEAMSVEDQEFIDAITGLVIEREERLAGAPPAQRWQPSARALEGVERAASMVRRQAEERRHKGGGSRNVKDPEEVQQETEK